MKMIRFRDYLNENLAAGELSKVIKKSGIDSKGLDNDLTREALNAAISKTTSHDFITPYIALGAVQRVLAYASIILPQYVFLDKEKGEVVFDINQFGRMDGINMDASEADSNSDGSTQYFVYFAYEMNSEGYYDVFAAICNPSELEEIMGAADDVDDDVGDGDNDEDDQISEEVEDLSEAKKTPAEKRKELSDYWETHGFLSNLHDFEANYEHPDKRKMKRYEKDIVTIQQKVQRKFGKNVAHDMMRHTNHKLDSWYGYKGRNKHGEEAAKALRDKHKIEWDGEN